MMNKELLQVKQNIKNTKGNGITSVA